jgi:hypothetical protein
MKLDDFLECLEASIACTGHGRIAHLPDKVYTKGRNDIAVWHLKPWAIMISGFGTRFRLGGFTQ